MRRDYLLFVGRAHDQDFDRYIGGIPDFYVLSHEYQMHYVLLHTSTQYRIHRIVSFDYYLYFMLRLCYNSCLSFVLIGICRTLCLL